MDADDEFGFDDADDAIAQLADDDLFLPKAQMDRVFHRQCQSGDAVQDPQLGPASLRSGLAAASTSIATHLRRTGMEKAGTSSEDAIPLFRGEDEEDDLNSRPGSGTRCTPALGRTEVNGSTAAPTAFKVPTMAARPGVTTARRVLSGPVESNISNVPQTNGWAAKGTTSSHSASAVAKGKQPGRLPQRGHAGVDVIEMDDLEDEFDDSFFQYADEVELRAMSSAGTPNSTRTNGSHTAVGQRRSTPGVFRPRQSSGSGSGAEGGGNNATGGLRQMNLFGKAISHEAPSRPAVRAPGLLVLSANRSHSSGANGAQTSTSASGGAGHAVATGRSRSGGIGMGAKKWDRNVRAASGPAWQRQRALASVGAGSLVVNTSSDELQEDWDESRRSHRLAGVGMYSAGVVGRASVNPQQHQLLEIANAGPPLPMKNKIDEEAAKTWIYPTNMEARDYQYNIVSKALFNNVLVALPTGLGKTFIAAVVILNFFRWYPHGKIIFVAPTRPLVGQQQMACHGICGLPWDVAIELTGETRSSIREEDWKAKRIFYMTPQTLNNDLEKGNCDARDVVCIVIDEAHRATGRFAYTTIMQLLMARNPYFRVLALSATPGKDSEHVQMVIDNLHINAIEIRTDDAIDIRRYVHRKSESVVRVARDPVIESLKDKWASLMEKNYLKAIKSFQLLRGDQKAETIKPYTLQSLQRTAHDVLKAKPYLRKTIAGAQQMAFAMSFLLDSSAMIFRDRVLAICDGDGKGGSGSSKSAINRGLAEVQDILTEVNSLKVNDKFYRHPKMDMLREILEQHFNEDEIAALQDQDQAEASGNKVSHMRTRAMVFCSSRECVEEIVANLNSVNMDACRFVGQQADRNGSRGMGQAEQKQVIRDFKEGKYRVLVATSIGEEGLDIGEIDLIVCYDATSDPVRMLQRVGRTGRKRDGKVVLLVTEGRDDFKHENAREKHGNVLKSITNGKYELYDDVERMVPPHIHPAVEKKAVPQPEFDTSMISNGRSRSSRTAASSKKGKKMKDPMRGVPEDDFAGFSKASELGNRPSMKGQKRSSGMLSDDTSDDDILCGRRAPANGHGTATRDADSEEEQHDTLSTDLALVLDDNSDDDLLTGFSTVNQILARAPRRDKSTGAARTGKAGVTQVGRSSTSINTSLKNTRNNHALARAQPAAKRPATVRSAVQPKGLARGGHQSACVAPTTASPTFNGPPMGRVHPLLAQFLQKENGVDDPAPSKPEAGKVQEKRMGNERHAAKPLSASNAPLQHIDLNVIKPSAAAEREPDSDTSSQPWSQKPLAIATSIPQNSIFTSQSDEEPLAATASKRSLNKGVQNDADLSDVPLSKVKPRAPSPHGPISSDLRQVSAAHDMQKARDHPGSYEEEIDTSPLIVRKRGQKRGPHILAQNSSSPPHKKQVVSIPETPPAVAPRKRKQAKRKIRNSPRSRMLFQYEADRSTDEEQHGESDEDDEGINTDSDSDDDRRAVGAFEATQAPAGYNQQAIYMQSLLSQEAPTPFRGGRSAANLFPGIGGRFGEKGDGGTGISKARRPVMLSSDAAAQDDDHYSMDSFVVDEDVLEYEDGYNGQDDSEL
ncbi:P-loop containing nucleoside triphosphate hydrolase protein [Tilletiaria anomala UBC 951]|uniref:ATP-dependent DNA helicase n=1 Tax=Tilletiaria anomala (strain ATCC 24038 / CBS 436.72 / UBC 951) TaxID=1037660 RepID=A0A066V757_TILAU|nr:P-loop containing nucleoside triphosphate hydrolase protein [Tilletiaria anomala UBC 951]KDN37577.1 P-loop containing nucleoside triphosphate hydrolase protein [Tilletiaria anomala UBC 951]